MAVRLKEVGDLAAKTENPEERMKQFLSGIADCIDEFSDNVHAVRGLAKELRGSTGATLAKQLMRAEPDHPALVHGVNA
jgi:hypothetical protein